MRFLHVRFCSVSVRETELWLTCSVWFGQNGKTLLRSVTNWHVYIFWFIFFLSYLFWTVYNLKSQYICPIQYHSYFEIFLVSIKVRHTDILHHSDDLKREKFDPSELQFRGGATMHCIFFFFLRWMNFKDFLKRPKTSEISKKKASILIWNYLYYLAYYFDSINYKYHDWWAFSLNSRHLAYQKSS